MEEIHVKYFLLSFWRNGHDFKFNQLSFKKYNLSFFTYHYRIKDGKKGILVISSDLKYKVQRLISKTNVTVRDSEIVRTR